MFRPTWWRRQCRRAPAVRPCARLRAFPLEERCVPATFVVSTNADAGAGSLRAAMTAANSTPGPDHIQFQISGGSPTIVLASPLPALTEKVTVDGSTQSGYTGQPLVVINGQSAGAKADGLVFRDNNFGSVVRGLSIVGFGGAAIKTTTNDAPIGAGAATIQGNYLGVLPDGKTAVSNGTGLWLENFTFEGDGTLVGGSGLYQGNLISGNGTGIYVRCWSNVFQGNKIGTDATGTMAVPNQVGIFELAGFNLFGGSQPGEGNLISGNTKYGLQLDAALNAKVYGNRIGTAANGNDPLGNGVGVYVGRSTGEFGLSDIGGTEPGQGNIIAYNQGAGVLIPSKTVDVAILGNSIFANAGLGIDVSASATADGPSVSGGTGGNGFQRPPQLAKVATDAGGTAITGSLHGEPNQVYRLEFFGNVQADPSGYGEGQNYLGSTSVTTNSFGKVNFATVVASVPSDHQVSATASMFTAATKFQTELYETSEFSVAKPVNGTLPLGGTIGGAVFVDADIDGVFDANEQPMSNVTVYLDANANGIYDSGESVATTVPDGKYQFQVATNGQYLVRTLLPNGYERSTADGVTVSVANGIPVEGINFGMYFLNAALGTITGLVYRDMNGNGQYESGEPGYAGFRVYSDANNNGKYEIGELQTISDGATGAYVLAVPAGTYRVRVEAPAGYSQLSAPPAPVTVAALGTVGPINFGLVPPLGGSIISGRTFVDANNNGKQDVGESAIGNVTVYVDVNNDATFQASEPNGASDGAGEFLFNAPGIQPGVARMVEPAGFVTSTNPPLVQPNAGTVSGLRLGLRPLTTGGTITGKAFVDCDHDNVLDSGEPVQSGLFVYVDVNGNGSIDIDEPAATTNFTGMYSLAVAKPGTYSLRAVAPHGHFLSGPGLQTVALPSGGTITAAPIGSYSKTQPVPAIATGAGQGGGPHVTVRNADGSVRSSFFAYDAGFTGGVRVATGDFTGDGFDDIITAPGPGGGPHIKVFDGVTGKLAFQTFAYAATFTGGVTVAAGDVDGDGRADIITGTGAGGGPHVKVFAAATGTVIRELFAYAPTFIGGVNVGAGDVTGDGRADIITGPGLGGGPHVKVFNGTNGQLHHQLFAYAATYLGGVNVAGGDVNGDGRADIITAPASNHAPLVKVFSGLDLAALRSFHAYNLNFTGGVRVGAKDLNGDGQAEIITGSGFSTVAQNQTARMRWWDGRSAASYFDQEIYPGFLGGMYVG